MAIINDEQIIKVLRQYNPWWKNPAAIKNESKPQKRVAFDDALRMIKHKTIRRFVVLSGARRVGKTTIMYQMMMRHVHKMERRQENAKTVMKQKQ